MQIYQQLFEKHRQTAKTLKGRYDLISIGRLVIALIFLLSFYFYTQTESLWLLIAMMLEVAAFIFVLRHHQHVEWKKGMEELLADINHEEYAYVAERKTSFENGSEYIDTDHSYTYDLDIFGENSLFHHLNRTGTLTGKNQLAHLLQSFLTNEDILANQGAIRELASKVTWRQQLLALTRLKPDSQKSYDQLMEWCKRTENPIHLSLKFISYVTPVLFFSSLVLSFLTPYAFWGKAAFLLFLINLFIVGTQISKIRKELIPSTQIDKILRQYGHLLQQIEDEEYESEKLNLLKKYLIPDHSKASENIHELSGLFARMDHVQNIFAGPLLNGSLLYHIHILRKLHTWRKDHAPHIERWLDVIGQFEAINSLANFSYNHPEYTFPDVNDRLHIAFEELGHPLIPKEKRIDNSVEFNSFRFFILTGSNMSGKSTFLRTLGVNMVLTSIGAPVCAKKADVHPLPVLVSMRLSDSLSDSESYFFAEVKRLKEIMDQLDKQSCFVLLDEILRGTNSDDKRTGTIEVIRKMVAKNAIGAIATHDLEVCKTTNEFPNILANKRFEVEIVNDELVFDYKLRDGVCQNKSATFLMKKMEVI